MRWYKHYDDDADDYFLTTITTFTNEIQMNITGTTGSHRSLLNKNLQMAGTSFSGPLQVPPLRVVSHLTLKQHESQTPCTEVDS